MGPITLFDKSFLQALSVNESLWFDNFFLTNVCPLFYIETLADLEKSVREGRTPEHEVGVIADKFPQMHGTPNAHHTDLCIGDLLGYPAPMTGQIPVAGGRLVETEGKRGAVFEQSPEAEAFSRWQQREFLEVERQYARTWRRMLSTLDRAEVSKAIQLLGIDAERCRNFEEAKELASRVVYGKKKPFELLKLALVFLNVPEQLRRQIIKRWRLANNPPLVDYAPYAAYVLEVEVFFQVAVSANLIASERPSNRVDIAYLFYLPFCVMFVSSDRLHRGCAPLFLRPDQQFVWGPDLKVGVSEINEHYLPLPEGIKEKGVMSFASEPPKVGTCIVDQLWERLPPRRREGVGSTTANTLVDKPDLLRTIKEMVDAPSLVLGGAHLAPEAVSQVVLKRSVTKRKGDWYQIPKSLESQDNGR